MESTSGSSQQQQQNLPPKAYETPFLRTTQGRVAMAGIAAFAALLLYNHFVIEQPQTAIHNVSGKKGKPKVQNAGGKN